MSHKPQVHVCVITYNHEKYIAKALESVLCQKGQFDLKILVGEDGSVDNTALIVREFADKYPDKITAFFHDPDDKIIINGRKSERKNFINNLVHADGDYIALLDGDDYWLDEKKLQKQIDFLEKNTSFVGCCHRAVCVDSDGNKLGTQLRHDTEGLGYRDFDIYDILKKNPIPSLSVVFRNPKLSVFPDWFYKTYMADWPLHIINAQRGVFRYFDEAMGAYRIHGGGAWAEHRGDAILVLEAEIRVWELILGDPTFGKYHDYINGLLKKNYIGLYKKWLRENQFNKAMKYVLLFEDMSGRGVVDLMLAVRFRLRVFYKYIRWKASAIIKNILGLV